MTIEKAVLEELTKDCQTPEDVDRLYGRDCNLKCVPA